MEGNALHDAPEKLARANGVTLSATFASRLVKQGGLVTVPAPDPGISFTGVLDLRSGKASYTPVGSASPSVVFSGDRVFALTPHARPDDARPWLATKLDEHIQDQTLDPSAVPGSMAAYALRPALLLDLLTGALTGSIRSRGADQVGGVPTTRYDVRFDLSRAFYNAKRVRYSQRQLDDLDKVFEILGVKTEDLDEGSVWLDAQGNPRRIVVLLRESPVSQSLVVVGIDLRLTPTDKPVSVTVPKDSAVVTVPSFFQLVTPLKPAARTAP